ncbi:YciI family protein [Phenylobacterium sp.]|uniref:YciI family protein n=1 Tax=Phenylobacterium sp. TaxID=1871053 RepID=UPI002C05B106|nr:YciI family protein [Phenylobacterium sp.]HLZ73401.1 YciI family protein [Phenylobacterium sp.]
MLYALLCYNSEEAVFAWSKAEDDAVMTRLLAVQDKLSAQRKLGPSLRLMPTTAATTLRKTDPPMVIDGPYAETKEQLLGLYILDLASLDEALDVARELGRANPGGAYEVRPLMLYMPGVLSPDELLAAAG